jgi:hypothetical protein
VLIQVRYLLTALLVSILLIPTGLFAQRVGTLRYDRLDQTAILSGANVLREHLLRELRRSGGDPESQHIHLVLGFSTGHFPTDPLAAEAARQVAAALVKNLLVAGDRVSVYAWEMEIWEHPAMLQNPWIVYSDSQREKDHVVKLFPSACRADSRGGHDTERAIVQITERIGTPTNQVVVLLTNSARSVAASSHRPLGENAPQYVAVLQNWRRSGMTVGPGAFLDLPYTVLRSNGERIARKMQVVILVPYRFRSSALEFGTRSERLKITAPNVSSPPPFGLTLGQFILAAGTVLLMVVLYLRNQLRRVQQAISGVSSLMEHAIAANKDANPSGRGSLDSFNQMIDDLREQRLVAIREAEKWQKSMIQMFESIENALMLPDVDAKVKATYEKVYRTFTRILSPLGFQVIRPSEGDPFDDRIHEVEEVVPDDELPDMSILRCTSWGYAVGSTVLRPARVILARRPSPVVSESDVPIENTTKEEG